MCGCSSNFKGDSKQSSNRMGSVDELMRKHKQKFSSFKGGLPKKQPIIDTKKHGISDEEYFSYNPKHSGNFSNFTDGRGFKHGNELNEYDF